MQKHILEQYIDLQAEEKDLLRRIQCTKDKLANLEGQQVADFVTCGKKGRRSLGTRRIEGFPFPEYEKQRKHLKTYELQLFLADERLLELLNEVEEYIGGIEDSRIRRILRYRYTDGFSWVQVAHRMGGRHTADNCRMSVTNYLSVKK